jgi:hypothetical protein
MSTRSSSNDVLSRRTLNRTLLERQMLLGHRELPVLDAVEHLVALQAQLSDPPYIALWSRLEGFERESLTELILDRSVVRSSLMRATIHLTSTADFLWLRPLVQRVLDRGQKSAFARRTEGIDLAELAAVGRELHDGRELTRVDLRKLLAERWPDRDHDALAWSVQALVPLVRVPPGGTWRNGGAVSTLAEPWLGRALATDPSPEPLVRRYLAAYGPASVADMRSWSGLSGLRDVVARLAPELRTFRDEAGKELFDLPDAPLSDPDAPAPPRFLPDYDNVLLGHDDRSRVIPAEYGKGVGIGRPTVLVDGFVRGTWNLARARAAATLTVEPFEPLSKKDAAAVAAEGRRLLAFAAEDLHEREVRILEPGRGSSRGSRGTRGAP